MIARVSRATDKFIATVAHAEQRLLKIPRLLHKSRRRASRRGAFVTGVTCRPFRAVAVWSRTRLRDGQSRYKPREAGPDRPSASRSGDTTELSGTIGSNADAHMAEGGMYSRSRSPSHSSAECVGAQIVRIRGGITIERALSPNGAARRSLAGSEERNARDERGVLQLADGNCVAGDARCHRPLPASSASQTAAPVPGAEGAGSG